MKKIGKTLVLGVLICLILFQLIPLSHSESESGQTSTPFSFPNEKPAGLEFTSDPIFSCGSAGSKNLICWTYTAVYHSGDAWVFLDPTGKQMSAEKLKYAPEVFEKIQVSKPYGSSKSAIYYDGNRISQALYDDVSFLGDCVVARREDGCDFFGLDGKQRFPGKLPDGYEARFVTSIGTVCARKLNPGITGGSGKPFYNFSLFDKNGKLLASSGFAANEDSETDPISFYTADTLMIDNGLSDLNGIGYGPGGFKKMIGRQNGRHIVTREQDTTTFHVIDQNHNHLGSFEADSIGDTVGSSLVIHNFRYGMVDENGTVIVEPQYTKVITETEADEYFGNQRLDRVIFFADGTYFLYDDKGTLLTKFSGYPNVSLRRCCILEEDDSGNTVVRDLDGNIVRHYEFGIYADNRFLIKNGVPFLRDEASNQYYVVDLAGNRLSEIAFTTINDDIVLPGLVNCKSGSKWYVVNAMGEVLNESKMDQPVNFLVPEKTKSGLEGILGVYYQNGKCGICRYVPAIGKCEKTADGIHAWRNRKTMEVPTCTQTGIAVFRCDACGKERTEQMPIDPENHAWTFTELLTEPGDNLHGGTARYTCSRCNASKEDKLCAGAVFTDMPKEGSWAHEPIDWAFFHGITAGKTANTFAPKATCTRADVVTFLWRAAGKPEPEAAEIPFTDVKESAYYSKAVRWAVEQGITKGRTETTFAPKAVCTRAEVVTFLWNAAGRPEPQSEECPFTDGKENAYYYRAMLWAYTSGITSGTSATAFSPHANCSRAQVVTFLYKANELLPYSAASD